MLVKKNVPSFRIGLVVGVAMLLGGGAAYAGDAQDRTELTFAGGMKSLNHTDWQPADTHYELGGKLFYQPASWPVGITAAYLYSHGSGNVTVPIDDGSYSYNESATFGVSTEEIRLGLKKVWDAGRTGAPYIEGGLLYGTAKSTLSNGSPVPISDYSESASSAGGWLGVGYNFHITQNVDLGPYLDYSYFQVKYDESSDTYSGGGVHLGANCTVHW